MKINKKILFIGLIGAALLTGCGSSSNSSSNQEGEGYKRLDANLETIPEKKVFDKYYAMKFEQPYKIYSSIISDVKMDYSEAVGFCGGLEIGEKEVAWRLPDAGELERLAPYSKPNSYFWSSEEGYGGNHKIVNLKTGDICNDTAECRNAKKGDRLNFNTFFHKFCFSTGICSFFLEKNEPRKSSAGWFLFS